MIVQSFFISSDSKYYSGKKKDGINPNAIDCNPDQIQCVEGKGIIGDRYFDYKKDFNGQITFISFDLHLKLQQHLNKEFSTNLYRRNVFLKGGDPLNELLGRQFQIGEAIFEGVEDCAPCGFMEKMIGAGTLKWMKQNSSGGLRAKILTSGTVKLHDQVIILN